MNREAELKKLEDKIAYYKNIDLFSVGLKPEEVEDLRRTRVQYGILKAQKEKDSGKDKVNQT